METLEIEFLSKVTIKGKDIAEIAEKFSVMDLFSDEARKHGAEFVEVCSVLEENHIDRTSKFNEHL